MLSLPVPVSVKEYCVHAPPVVGLVRLSSDVPSHEALKSLGESPTAAR